MVPVRVTVLGSSAGTPTRTNPASGYLVEHDEGTIWIDAGTGTFMRLAERVDPGQLSAVVISHVHVDHSSDLFGLYGYLAYGPSGRVPVPVFVTEGATNLFGDFAGATGEHVFHHVLGFREVGAGDTATVGPFALEFGAANHSVANNVTRVKAGGRTLVYTGDTGPSDAVVKMADRADLFLCEATFVGERDNQTYPYHLTAYEAGDIATRAGVGHLVLTHISHTVDPFQSIAEAAERFSGPISYAEPGTEFDV